MMVNNMKKSIFLLLFSCFITGLIAQPVTEYWDKEFKHKKSEQQTKDGMQDGKSMSWYENGDIAKEGNFTRGKEDGKFITTLPIGRGTDGGGFNPNTMEAFSSQGDGTLTIIQEKSPTSFEVEQTVQTKARAKTCTLDTKNNRIILITTESAPASGSGESAAGTPSVSPVTPLATPPAGGDRAGGGGRGGRSGGGGPGMLDLIVVGR